MNISFWFFFVVRVCFLRCMHLINYYCAFHLINVGLVSCESLLSNNHQLGIKWNVVNPIS